jgi:hypothetical protein
MDELRGLLMRRSRELSAALALTLALATTAAAAGPASGPPAAPPAGFPSIDRAKGDFTVVVLPDIQRYSLLYPPILRSQIHWVVTHKDQLDIRFVADVGDLTDDGTQEVGDGRPGVLGAGRRGPLPGRAGQPRLRPRAL